MAPPNVDDAETGGSIIEYNQGATPLLSQTFRMPNDQPQIDAHAHAFPLGAVLAPNRRYMPTEEAPLARYLSELDAAGMTHGVLTQPSFLGTDNSYLLSCLSQSDRLRGVVVIDPEIDDRILALMKTDGVVGMRLNLLGKTTDFVLEDSWQKLFTRVARAGWHIELHAEARNLPPMLDALWPSGVAIVVDHFGRPDPHQGMRDPGIRALLDKAGSKRIWVKFSGPYRCGGDINAYAEEYLRHLGAGRIVWGSDFPWTQHSKGMSYQIAREWLDTWIPDPDLRRQVLGASAANLFDLPA
jgi:predicted TIM-barrel fold metal-dependent hydrolase